MAVRRFLLALSVLAVAVALAAWPTAANGSGAPSGAATEGCTCHSGQPSDLAEVTLDGVPETYVPGRMYNLTVTVTGTLPRGGLNQGGFAIEVDGGQLVATDTQTVQLREGMATHTTAGNDLRTWTIGWNSTFGGNETVTFSFAANAVNGNGIADPADQWTRATMQASRIAEQPRNTSAAPAPTPQDDTPPVGALVTMFGVIAVVVALRRRA